MNLTRIKASLKSRVLRESPATLLREFSWRLSKRIQVRRFRTILNRAKYTVEFRPVGFYQPSLTGMPASASEATVSLADQIVDGVYPFLGYGNVSLGPQPNWSRDFVSGHTWEVRSSELLEVVQHNGSDVKVPWELSRLQFLPILAKAYRLTNEEKYRAAVRHLLTWWIDQNPCGLGVNWTIAMEAALRAISICLTLELLWPVRHDEQDWLNKVSSSLWQHLLFIEAHSEFSHLVRSNHYLSNIVGLTTLSAVLRGPGMDKRFRRYANAVQREILLQTHGDGGDFEASTGYHVLVSQMFLHSYLVQRARGIAIAPFFEDRLSAMFEWLAILADEQGTMPQLGDCDDGRVELMLDDIRQAAIPVEQRDSLRLASYLGLGSYLFGKPFGGDGSDAVWFGAQSVDVSTREQRRIEVLGQSGLAVARSNGSEVVFAAMPNGINGRGSHTHCDKLGFILRLDQIEIFCDSGTFCYTRDAIGRNRFRSATAHNVVVVDGLEQNDISRNERELFRLGNDAITSPIAFRDEDETITLSASHSGYERIGVRCARSLRLSADNMVIEDEMAGSGVHSIDLFFHLGPGWSAWTRTNRGRSIGCNIVGRRSLELMCDAVTVLQLDIENSEISRAYGSSLPATRIHISTVSELPAKLITRIRWTR